MHRYPKDVEHFPVYVFQPNYWQEAIHSPAMETDITEYSPIVEERPWVSHRKAYVLAVRNGTASHFLQDSEISKQKWLRDFS
jgi:hypothetical protein